jgi:hypothetical protein
MAGVTEPGERDDAELLIRPRESAGVWANGLIVSTGMHEFTLDFVRSDPLAPPPGRAIVVARVAVSPWFVSEMIATLRRNWRMYAARAMPPEAQGEDGLEPEDRGPL